MDKQWVRFSRQWICSLRKRKLLFYLKVADKLTQIALAVFALIEKITNAR
jgi:hypothetical protein